MKVSQNTRCAFGLHKCEVLKQEDKCNGINCNVKLVEMLK